jgi:hypothetical protein
METRDRIFERLIAVRHHPWLDRGRINAQLAICCPSALVPTDGSDQIEVSYYMLRELIDQLLRIAEPSGAVQRPIRPAVRKAALALLDGMTHPTAITLYSQARQHRAAAQSQAAKMAALNA